MPIKVAIRLEDLPELMTVEQTAAYLSVSKNTVYSWCNANELPSFKQGNVRRIRKSVFIAWIEQQESSLSQIPAD